MEEKIMDYYNKHPMSVLIRLIITLLVVALIFLFIINFISSFIIRGILCITVIMIAPFAFIKSFPMDEK